MVLPKGIRNGATRFFPLNGARALRVLVTLAPLALVAPLVLGACDSATQTPEVCLGALSPTTLTVPMGGAASLTLSYANPDNDNGGNLYVDWSASGGAHFDQVETSLTLTPGIDGLGYPAGNSGTSANAVTADGPPGTYALHVAVAAGLLCNASGFDAQLIVTPALPDAGSADAALLDAADAGSD